MFKLLFFLNSRKLYWILKLEKNDIICVCWYGEIVDVDVFVEYENKKSYVDVLRYNCVIVF